MPNTHQDQGSELVLLTSFRDRLIAKVSGLSAVNCVISDSAIPSVWPADPCCTVSPGDSQFREDYWNGGGPNQLTSQGSIAVTMFMRCVLDRPPDMETIMVDATQGLLLKWKPPILKALLVNDATWSCNYKEAWQPTTTGGLSILRQPPRPISCSSPRFVPTDEQSTIPFLAFTFTLEVEYDWLL